MRNPTTSRLYAYLAILFIGSLVVGFNFAPRFRPAPSPVASECKALEYAESGDTLWIDVRCIRGAH